MPITLKSSGAKAPLPVLTSDEKHVLQLVAEGHGLEDICRRLDLPESEVDCLLHASEEKLGAKNRLHAVTIAVLNGHITLGPEEPV